jgi:hypothetical protein
MKRWLLLPWRVFKWTMVVVGAVVVLLATISLFLDKPRQSIFVNPGPTGCDFSFSFDAEAWRQDRRVVTTGLVSKTSNLPPDFYLHGERDRHRAGVTHEWSVTRGLGCMSEELGTVRLAQEGHARIFLATDCKKRDDGYDPNISTRHFLYGVMTRPTESDYIWIASDDSAALRAREAELREMVKSYTPSHPTCRSGKQP